VLEDDGGVQWFPWLGTRGAMTLWLWAKKQQIPCCRNFLSLTYDEVSRSAFQQHLRELVESEVNAVELAAQMPTKRRQKFDLYVDGGLLDKANGSDRIDLPEAEKAAERALLELAAGEYQKS
jgi:hypothetical protein